MNIEKSPTRKPRGSMRPFVRVGRKKSARRMYMEYLPSHAPFAARKLEEYIESVHRRDRQKVYYAEADIDACQCGKEKCDAVAH